MVGTFKFIHCADLHLGSGFTGLVSVDEKLGKAMVESTFAALENLVSAVEREKPDFVVISGDVFDSDEETPLTRSRFADALARMVVPCYIAYGNHDYSRKWEKSIPLPENAYVFGPGIGRFSYPSEDEEIARIYGISHSSKTTRKNLADGIEGVRGVFCIGAVHCDLDGTKESVYSPCPLQSLKGKDIDYWALGHIHKREIANKDPYVVYPGNTQGRNVKESGEKGAYLVTVREGKVFSMDFLRTGNILWMDVEWDITGHGDMAKFIDDGAGNLEKGSMVNVKIRGSGQLDAMLRQDPAGFIDLFEKRSRCVCSGLTLETLPEIDLEARKESGDFISAMLEYSDILLDSARLKIIDAICSTPASSNIRPVFQEMDDSELSAMVRDAAMLVLSKSMEAER